MKILCKKNYKIFDGCITEQSIIFESININQNKYEITSDEIFPISEMPHNEADLISKLFDFPILEFDNEKIYKGSKDGLNLYKKEIEEGKLAIFSFGEYQPNRFICIYEGLVSTR